MKIEKRTPKSTKTRTKNCYGKKFGGAISVTASVRDAILPHRYIEVEIVSPDSVLLLPTDNQNAYKLTICSGQARFAWRYAEHLLNIPEGVELPITKNGDGSLTMNIPKAVKL